MGNLYENIIALCDEIGIKGGKMCTDIGISKGLLTDLKMGRRSGLSASTAQKIASYFDVSVGYLLGEEENKKIAFEKSNAIFLDNSNVRMIPLFESVSAGFGANASEEIVDYVPCYIDSDYEAENTMCLKVWGDSMSPKIENGDIIQVIKQSSVDSGSLAVVLVDGDEGVVKRVVYGKSFVELHSINPAYSMRRFEGEEITRLRVVGLVKKIIKEV